MYSELSTHLKRVARAAVLCHLCLERSAGLTCTLPGDTQTVDIFEALNLLTRRR